MLYCHRKLLLILHLSSTFLHLEDWSTLILEGNANVEVWPNSWFCHKRQASKGLGIHQKLQRVFNMLESLEHPTCFNLDFRMVGILPSGLKTCFSGDASFPYIFFTEEKLRKIFVNRFFCELHNVLLPLSYYSCLRQLCKMYNMVR